MKQFKNNNYICDMNFNQEIKDVGISKTKLAEKLGISNVMFSYYINGTRAMPDDKMLKLKELIKKYKSI